MITSVARRRIVSAAKDLVGVPFRHHGRCTSGLDCVGLLIAVGKSAGIMEDSFNVLDYPPFPEKEDGILEIRFEECRYFEEIENPKAGTIASLRIGKSKVARHSGILTGKGTMIHCSASDRKVVEARFDERWIERTKAFYDYAETA